MAGNLTTAFCLRQQIARLILAGAVFCSSVCLAEVRTIDENLVKAGFITKFPLYVSWIDPQLAERSEAFIVNVLGESDLTKPLMELAKHCRINGRPVEVRTVSDFREAAEGQMLVLSEKRGFDLSSVVAYALKKSIITVSTDKNDYRSGVIFTLFVQLNKVRFALDYASAERAGIKISKRLLDIASAVR